MRSMSEMSEQGDNQSIYVVIGHSRDNGDDDYHQTWSWAVRWRMTASEAVDFANRCIFEACAYIKVLSAKLRSLEEWSEKARNAGDYSVYVHELSQLGPYQDRLTLLIDEMTNAMLDKQYRWLLADEFWYSVMEVNDDNNDNLYRFTTSVEYIRSWA